VVSALTVLAQQTYTMRALESGFGHRHSQNMGSGPPAWVSAPARLVAAPERIVVLLSGHRAEFRPATGTTALCLFTVDILSRVRHACCLSQRRSKSFAIC